MNEHVNIHILLRKVEIPFLLIIIGQLVFYPLFLRLWRNYLQIRLAVNWVVVHFQCIQCSLVLKQTTQRKPQFYFIENITTFLDKAGAVGAVVLDVKKAFDTVNHRILMSKLSCFCFSSLTLTWIESYLSDIFQCVLEYTITYPMI